MLVLPLPMLEGKRLKKQCFIYSINFLKIQMLEEMDQNNDFII